MKKDQSFIKLSLLVCVVLTVGLFATNALAKAKAKSKWQMYKGAWFTIEYPPGFKVRPSQKDDNPNNGSKGYDSVFFKSPDGSVEFYVFSPLRAGVPTDIRLNRKTEVLITHQDHSNGLRRINYYTVRAKNKSYMRSWVETSVGDDVFPKAFGIKYRDKKSYDKYKNDYTRFKSTLIQYTDH